MVALMIDGEGEAMKMGEAASEEALAETEIATVTTRFVSTKAGLVDVQPTLNRD